MREEGRGLLLAVASGASPHSSAPGLIPDGEGHWSKIEKRKRSPVADDLPRIIDRGG